MECLVCVFGSNIVFWFQTLNSISAEKNSTVIFPLPIDLITNILHGEKDRDDKESSLFETEPTTKSCWDIFIFILFSFCPQENYIKQFYIFLFNQKPTFNANLVDISNISRSLPFMQLRIFRFFYWKMFQTARFQEKDV